MKPPHQSLLAAELFLVGMVLLGVSCIGAWGYFWWCGVAWYKLGALLVQSSIIFGVLVPAGLRTVRERRQAAGSVHPQSPGREPSTPR